jgi:hypothetical protein
MAYDMNMDFRLTYVDSYGNEWDTKGRLVATDPIQAKLIELQKEAEELWQWMHPEKRQEWVTGIDWDEFDYGESL